VRSEPDPSLPAGLLLPGAIEQYLATDVVVCVGSDRVGAIRRQLAGHSYDSIHDIVVCDVREPPRRPCGLIPSERLFAAGDDVLAQDIMDADPPVAVGGLDEEKAAWKAVQHAESSLVVVDREGLFRGLVPPARLLGGLLRSHDQDFARLGGYLSSTASARHASEEPLLQRLWHRLPWLLVGLVGAALSAWLVGSFEQRIADDVRVAFFIPGIVYMADAVGTQTEALFIRGLSVGASLRRMFLLEALTGPLMGTVLGLAALPAIALLLGSAGLGLAVAIALLAACGVATLVAMVLPWLMELVGKDPAFGSGPLATVVQDLLSLVIYFAAVEVALG